MACNVDGIEELRGQRQGVCHRCGWPGIVGEVRHHDRRRLQSGHSYGRLCRECVNDLHRAQPVFRSTLTVTAAKAGRSRQVA
jgi:hypothetical protein